MMDIKELNKTIEDMGKTFEEYKVTNDELKELVKNGGNADPLIEAKLLKMDTAMDELQTKIAEGTGNERLDNLEAQLNRIGLSGGGAGGAQMSEAEKEYGDAFNLYMRHGDGERELKELARKAELTTLSDPGGGFGVLPQLDTNISRVLANTSAMRSVANVVPISAHQYERIVNIGGTSSGWVGERESRTETNTPTLEKIIIEAMELYAEPATTQIMLDDGFWNVENWLAEEVAIEFNEEEGAAFITGNGFKKPRGILDYDTVANASYAWGSVGFVISGVNGAFPAAGSGSGDPLIDLVYALRAGYRQNASWLMNNLTQATVRKLKDTNDNYYWQPGLIAGQPATLLGYAINEDDNMPALATDSLSISFGDWQRAYTIADRMGVRVLRDDLTSKGFVKFYTTKRVGAGITNFEALKHLKFSS